MRTVLSAVATVAVLSLLTPAPSAACSFDTDCKPGSCCLKKPVQIYGVCVGGLFPGNKNDRKPVYDPLDVKRSVGNTCSFDTDCGPGSSCVKEAGQLYGTCLRGSTKYRTDGCSFNSDCGVGYLCLKSGFSLRGVCTKK
jgi:hypothetical protein